jgi:predicted transcriptional regulator
MIDDRKAPRYCAAMIQPASPTPAAVIRFRRSLGMTQREVAAMAGVHAVTWSRWECGKMAVDPWFWRILLAKEFVTHRSDEEDAYEKLKSIVLHGKVRRLDSRVRRKRVAHVIEHGSLGEAA